VPRDIGRAPAHLWIRTKARVKSLDLCREKFLLVRLNLREKRLGEKTESVCPLAPASGTALRRYAETGSTWLCVQHEEDGANACTSADESIWRQFFPDTAARFNDGP
jgi:hypothetical protein